MARSSAYDAVVVGSGPNGLAAAIALAQAGRSVAVFEAKPTVGGGMRSAEVTLPGFVHDICSAVHPLGVASPFFRSVPLERFGLEWIHPPIPMAHPLPDGPAALLHRSIAQTAQGFGAHDGAAWQAMMEPLARDWDAITQAFLGPLRPGAMLRHPLALGRFGAQAVLPATWLARARFQRVAARALFGGMAAHAMLPLEQAPSAAFGLMLGASAHAVGWPIARGGSQAIADALAGYLRSLGGEIFTDTPIDTLDALPASRVVLCDVAPRQLLRLAERRLPTGYANALRRFRYGPGSFKIDYALDGPVPWRDSACLRAGTVHLGGALDEIAASERRVARGELPERPFTLVAQQSLFDTTRAPEGKQTLWAYCHTPHGSTVDMTTRIEAQIERFAPGFRDRVLARSVRGPADLERYNPNYVGGDINGGLQDLRQLFTRPTLSLDPYRTPVDGLYICSSSTPPGGGVHGMCGFWAAHDALAGPLR